MMKKFDRLIFVAGIVLLWLSISSTAYSGEGHDAGYEWAQEHDIRDTGYNNGNSESFNEGVRQYAEEMQEEEKDSKE